MRRFLHLGQPGLRWLARPHVQIYLRMVFLCFASLFCGFAAEEERLPARIELAFLLGGSAIVTFFVLRLFRRLGLNVELP